MLDPVQLRSQKPCLTVHLRSADVAVAVLALQHLSADALVTVLRHKDGQGLDVSHRDFHDATFACAHLTWVPTSETKFMALQLSKFSTQGDTASKDQAACAVPWL